MHNSYQIYALVDPRDNSVRYVGFSNDAQIRLRGHLNGDGGKRQERRWIHRLIKNGQFPILQVLETIEAGDDALTIACERELYWIHEMARLGHLLFNISGLSQPFIPPSVMVYKPKRTWIPVIRKVNGTTGTDHSANTPFSNNESRTLEEVYTVQEVAQNLKVSGRTVRNWIESGELQLFQLGNAGTESQELICKHLLMSESSAILIARMTEISSAFFIEPSAFFSYPFRFRKFIFF